jgi:hypothetical protein
VHAPQAAQDIDHFRIAEQFGDLQVKFPGEVDGL